MGGSPGQSSAPSTSTQTTTSEPWEEQKPYLEEGFQRAEDLYQSSDPQFYPEITVTPFSPETQTALGATAQRALQGNPLQAAGQQQQMNTIQGKYTNPESNPFYKNMVQGTMAQVRPGIDSMFAKGGRAGSGAHAERLGTGLGNALGPQMFADYGRERGLQQSAAQTAPALAQADYYDIDRLGQVGAQREGKSTDNLQDLINRFNFGQNREATKVNQYNQQVGGSYGGTTTEQANAQQPSYGGK